MSLATLHDLWIHELKDLYSAERQLVQALPRMSKNANSDELRTAIDNHLAETEEQVSRLEQILETMGESTRGVKCEGMEGLIEEGKTLLKEDADPEVLDAGIIMAAQKVEHYEIAAYGSVCEYARIMGHTEALQLLEQTLEEEKNADRLLTEIAESGINALAERDDQADMESGENGPASRSGSESKGSARRRPSRSGGRSKSRSAS